MLGGALFIAREDLAQLLRQRGVILWVFLMPGLFFYFIGTVTGSMPSPAGRSDRPDPIALVAPMEDWLVDGLAERLEEGNFDVSMAADGAALEANLILEVEPAAGGEPPGAAAARGEPVSLRLVNRHEGPGAELYQLRVARAVYTTAAELVLLAEGEGQVDGAGLASLRQGPRLFELRVSTAGRRRLPPSGFEQAVPGIIVMFTMLVLLTTGTHMMTVERELGLLRRLASTPIPRAAIVLGKWLARMALGIVQIGVGMVVGTLLFGVDWTEGLGLLLGVLIAWAAFNAAFAILLANLVTSAAQGAATGMLVTMLLAALGGCWWPIEVTPPWMQTLALALPSGWAMDAMHRVVSFGLGGRSVIPHLVAMTAAALICAAVAARRFRFQ